MLVIRNAQIDKLQAALLESLNLRVLAHLRAAPGAWLRDGASGCPMKRPCIGLSPSWRSSAGPTSPARSRPPPCKS